MRRNSLIIGNRSYEGKFKRILGAGSINIINSSIKSIYFAGEVNINASDVDILYCAGAIDVTETNFAKFKCAGDIDFKGICKADLCAVAGDLSAAFLECRILKNSAPSKNTKTNSTNGIYKWNGSFKSETFENFYLMDLTYDYEFKNIISSYLISSKKEIVCENFYSFSGIHATDINSENIFIFINNDTVLSNLVGSNITISKTFKREKRFGDIPKSAGYKNAVSNANIINVQNIEGDNINIENCKVKNVVGVNIIIGDLCIIDRVEYKESIYISDKAIVSEVVKL
ncbi:MAG: hypothetical protein ACYCYI_06145 [Saccharofermentanales bacterium]